MTRAPLPPGSTLGILGDGQLGRMLCLAAYRLGFETIVFGDKTHSPAAQVGRHVQGDYTDLARLRAFGQGVDALTYEWESVPVTAVEAAASGMAEPHVSPSLDALKIAQDRLLEKTFLGDLPGVAVAPFRAVETVHALRRAVQFVGLPCVVKTRRGGYDGKGQAVIRDEDDIVPVWEALGAFALIVEGFVNFTRETSLVCARGHDGQVRAYPMAENVHRDHVLHQSTAPASVSTHDVSRDMNGGGYADAPTRIAHTIVAALDYVGVIGIELFDTADGWIVNEIAPRVHNSGHWTQDAGCTDQFEQHVRAVAGWPLGDTVPSGRVQMTNLIGADVDDWAALAAEPGTRLHLYGKSDARPGRKMGHVNRRLD